jgi:mevalonate kinase
MKKIAVSSPGKLHLLGEHAVVHNKPAIIAAVNKRCFVQICIRKDAKIIVTSKNYKKSITTDFSKIISKFQKAEKDYAVYAKTNDIKLLKSITGKPLDYPLLIIGQFINYFSLNTIEGFDLTIDSQIPSGAGMGSSAALAVAITGALCLLTNKPFDKKIINQIAYLSEQKKHGLPSGGDNTTSCFGSLIWFKKDAYSGKAKMKPLAIKISKNISKNFYVANTGTPKETTGEMVSRVGDLLKKNPKETKSIFNDQERLVKNLLLNLKKENSGKVLEIIKSGENNLEKLGVVSVFVQKVIREIEDSGGAAKICGGGGIKKGTGMLLIYHPEGLKNLKNALRIYQLEPIQLELGAEGLRVEKNSDTI